MLIDTPMTDLIFQQWFTDRLIPEIAPGSIVVCDNLPGNGMIRRPFGDA